MDSPETFPTLFFLLIQAIQYFLLFIGTLFWFWMLFDCIQNEPDRIIWILLIIFLSFPGALVYFIARKAPRMSLPLPACLSRWKRRRELWEAESAAVHIGKAHQFVILGDLLRETRQFRRAREAYAKALAKDAENAKALWGASLLDVRNKQFETARTRLESLLALEPTYSYGDASLAYAVVLKALGQTGEAKVQLENHLKKWSHPEAHLRLARILVEQGQSDAARPHLETVIRGVKGGPKFQYRRNRYWAAQAHKLLKHLS